MPMGERRAFRRDRPGPPPGAGLGLSNFRDKATFLWTLAEILRGDYKPSEFGRVILPFVVLRRLDCVLEPSKADVLNKQAELEGKIENVEPILRRVSGEQFYNVSKLDFPRLLDDPDNVGANLRAYVAAFNSAAREILEKFKFDEQITRLDNADLLYMIIQRFAEVDLHPDAVSNLEMGYMFEELIRLSSEQSNETAGEHFTPREVVRLMVNLLFAEDDELLRKRGIVRTLYDPACGTGGMLSIAEDYLRDLNGHARLEVFGQELNDESYAICRSDMMLKGHDASHIHVGNSFTRDGATGSTFDYMLSNPPFGVEWKKVEKEVREEHETLGDAGRFGAGLPRVSDGSLLFLQHMIAKMKPPEKGGSRIGIVFNGSPLFTGGAGSGESEIRRWIIENDWLEAVIALPDQLFYNTGISTYIWVVTNRKPKHRQGKMQLIDARDLFERLPRNLGEKRKFTSEEQIAEITQVFAGFGEGPRSKIFDNDDFGYHRVTVERPLQLRYAMTEDALTRLEIEKPFLKLPVPVQEAVKAALLAAIADGRLPATDDRAEFTNAARVLVKEALDNVDGKRENAVVKIISALAALRDPNAPIVCDSKGRPAPDPELRDAELVPLKEDIAVYIGREVSPYWPDAWIDETKTKVGYEIPFGRHFYSFPAPRPLDEIDLELQGVERRIVDLLSEVTE